MNLRIWFFQICIEAKSNNFKNPKIKKERCAQHFFILVHFYPRARLSCSALQAKLTLKYMSFYKSTTKIMKVNNSKPNLETYKI